jgi:hypothetical protein
MSLWTCLLSVVLPWPWHTMTREVDAMFVPHGVVLEEAAHVADELGQCRTADDHDFKVTAKRPNRPGR